MSAATSYPTLSQDEHGTSLALLRPTHADMLARIQAVKDVIAKGCTDAELSVFAEACRRTGLDPFAKQIYAIKRFGANPTMTIQTGIDGFRVVAERSGKYRGQDGPYWCGEDGVWHDVWLTKTPPVACRVGILRSDFDKPVWGVARTAAYRNETNALWNTMPDVLIARSAEALAIRKAFPNDMSGVYGNEEMEQADNNPPTQGLPATAAPIREEGDGRRVVEAAPAQQPRPKRSWKALQARAHAVGLYKTQDDWEKLVRLICGFAFDPKQATNDDYDAVEDIIADRERTIETERVTGALEDPEDPTQGGTAPESAAADAAEEQPVEHDLHNLPTKHARP